jgi:superfamily II helicase
MLTESEKKELNYHKLSPELKLKIDTAFESPDLIIAIAYSKQIQALTSEMINKPFTIRGEDDIEVSADGVKEALKEAITSRQNTETALKVLNSLLELAENLKKIQARLSPEQQDLSKKEIITHTDIKKVAFGK